MFYLGLWTLLPSYLALSLVLLKSFSLLSADRRLIERLAAPKFISFCVALASGSPLIQKALPYLSECNDPLMPWMLEKGLIALYYIRHGDK